jgi:Ricin-type beta-trefoil lectin domain-like
MGVSGALKSQGAPVVGFTCILSHRDQYWAVDTSVTCSRSGVPFYLVVNLNSGLDLGVAGNSPSNGAPVVQWPYQNTCNNQFWAFLNP